MPKYLVYGQVQPFVPVGYIGYVSSSIYSITLKLYMGIGMGDGMMPTSFGGGPIKAKAK